MFKQNFIKKSFSRAGKHFPLLIPVLFAVFFIAAGEYYLLHLDLTKGYWNRFAIAVGGYFAKTWVQLVFLRLCLLITEGDRHSIREALMGPVSLLAFVAAQLLYTSIVLLGLALLIIPGIIWAIQFQFFSYSIADRACGPITALKDSSRMTRGFRWPLLAMNLLAIGLNLLGLFFFGIGLLITIPVTVILFSYLYFFLNEQRIQRFASNI